MSYSIGSRFNCFFALMNRLNADIIIFILSYRPVSLGCDCRRGSTGNRVLTFCRLFQFRPKLRLFKTEFRASGFGNIFFSTKFFLWLGSFFYGLFCLVHRFFGTICGLADFIVRKIVLCEA